MTMYNNYIMQHVRQNLGLEPDDTSEDDRINKMSHDEILDRVSTWGNLINYGSAIRFWIESIYKVELK